MINKNSFVANYNYFEKIISTTICRDNRKIKNANILKELVIILLVSQKGNDSCDKEFNRLIDLNDQKYLVFDVLLDYSKELGNHINFKNRDIHIYKDFATYSLNKKIYIHTLEYLSEDIIQLKILYELKDEVYKYGLIIKYKKLKNSREEYQVTKN